METFLCRKNTASAKYFLFFCFGKKAKNSGGKNIFVGNNTISHAFCSKFATISDFGKKSSLFGKKPNHFLKNSEFERMRNLTIWVASAAFVLQFVGKRKETCTQLATIGSKKKVRVEWMLFSPFFNYGRKQQNSDGWKTFQFLCVYTTTFCPTTVTLKQQNI